MSSASYYRKKNEADYSRLPATSGLIMSTMWPGIPNYNLQQCYDETPELQTVKPVTLRASLVGI